MGKRSLDAATLSLKQFMQRKDVLGLYRDLFRTIREIDDDYYKTYLRDQVRTRFGFHRNENDSMEIKVLLQKGRMELEDFQKIMNCAPTSTHRSYKSDRPPSL